MNGLYTSREVGELLRHWVRERRLARQWSQAELAQRAGIQLDTYRLFETKGKVSLQRFLKVLEVLGGLDVLAGLVQAPEPQSITELLAEPPAAGRRRARGRQGAPKLPFFGTGAQLE